MKFGGSGMPKKVVAHKLIIIDRRMISKKDGNRIDIKDCTKS